MEFKKQQKKAHFVLVHGACHGAWCWYKIVDLLQQAGRSVTAIDLAASGIHPTDPNAITSFHEYNQPLLDLLSSLNNHQKVILVGHSLGGISVSYAAERYPQKLAATVYVAARKLPAGLPFEEHFSKNLASFSPKFYFHNGPENDPTSFIFAADSLKETLYNRSPSEDIILAAMLLRPNPMAAQIPGRWKATEEGYGSVRRVVIKALDDRTVCTFEGGEMVGEEEEEEEEVLSIDSDHSPFFSAPQELCSLLLDIEAKYC